MRSGSQGRGLRPQTAVTAAPSRLRSSLRPAGRRVALKARDSRFSISGQAVRTRPLEAWAGGCARVARARPPAERCGHCVLPDPSLSGSGVRWPRFAPGNRGASRQPGGGPVSLSYHRALLVGSGAGGCVVTGNYPEATALGSAPVPGLWGGSGHHARGARACRPGPRWARSHCTPRRGCPVSGVLPAKDPEGPLVSGHVCGCDVGLESD